jgi:hypothetical protein
MFGEADIRAYDAERDAKLGKQPRRAKATALRKASRSRYALDPEVIATGRLPEKAVVVLAYHVLCKPTEIFAIVSGEFNKTPAETWRQYAWLFREYWTAVVSPELLAALAQVEGAGNPLARTYWRWQLSWNPLALYQPASSGVGMAASTRSCRGGLITPHRYHRGHDAPGHAVAVARRDGSPVRTQLRHSRSRLRRDRAVRARLWGQPLADA